MKLTSLLKSLHPINFNMCSVFFLIYNLIWFKKKLQLTNEKHNLKCPQYNIPANDTQQTLEHWFYSFIFHIVKKLDVTSYGIQFKIFGTTV